MNKAERTVARKLKEYICEDGSSIFSIFGTLMSPDCLFVYKDENDEWKEYRPGHSYSGEYDFLLEYYVMGISPKYEIINDKIVPYLYITLVKNLED